MAKPKLIVFLDKDNMLLSATAEQVFRLLLEKNGLRNITIVSAGETNLGFIARDEGMDAVLAKDKLQISGLVNPLSQSLLEYADWVVCMDNESRESHQIRRMDWSGKRLFDFPTKDSLAKLVVTYPLDYVNIHNEVEAGCLSILRELEG